MRSLSWGAFAGLTAALVGAPALAGETLTIATVNNGDMIIMQKLSSQWEGRPATS